MPEAVTVAAILTKTGPVLAFDFGEKRIGVAVGDWEVKIAHPVETIAEAGNEARFAAIERLIKEWHPRELVVGLPASLDGEEHELSRLCRRFARRLEGRFNLPVMLVDERLSSMAASQSLNEKSGCVGVAKPVLDQVAAQHILQSFLMRDDHEPAGR